MQKVEVVLCILLLHSLRCTCARPVPNLCTYGTEQSCRSSMMATEGEEFATTPGYPVSKRMSAKYEG